MELVTGDRMRGPRWERLLPEAKEKAIAILRIAQERGLDVVFYDGWRSPEESAANIAAGTSKIKDPLDSMHVWGAAFDIVFRNSFGQPSWPDASDPRWRELAQIGVSIGLLSGGISWGWDWPHFQLPNVNVAALKQSYRGDYLAYLNTMGVA